MNKYLTTILLAFSAVAAFAQGQVKGKVSDKASNTALSYVNIRVSEQGQEKVMKGAMTDENGHFNITGLAYGNYTLTVSLLGYKTVMRNFTLSESHPSVSYANIFIAEDAKTLKEVTVTGQRSSMKLEVDRKTFNVEQDIASAGGSATDVLENIPSVEVDNDGNISLRGNSSVEVWINGKSSGLTSDNRGDILRQLPSESIERIEVIDNPSAKFSAEGSAGIINIILKKDRKAGYYGSVQVGGDTSGGARASANINYNSAKFDAYANVGYHHRVNKGQSESYQEFLKSNDFMSSNGYNNQKGNGIFSRAGITWHATGKDDFSLNGMMMLGNGKNNSSTPYHYGIAGIPGYTRTMLRQTNGESDMRMLYGEFNYKHTFSARHTLHFTVGLNSWKMNNENIYQDSTEFFLPPAPTAYSYQKRPMKTNSRKWEVKLDYENALTEKLKLQAGYQGSFSHENSPQESFVDLNHWDGREMEEDVNFYNRFLYDTDIHALYTTATYNFGKFGIMAGLRGEYWHVNTESYNWQQNIDASLREKPFDKDYFQLFPSIFMSYQLTPTQQLQLNYTRRLRRPWGGQLNSFKNTQDASMISFGNPELTPEFSNSFSLNYLKQWTEHSLLVSAYYRPTSDVIQRINYQNHTDGLMYQTSMNVTRSTSTGLELTLKDKFFRILDLTTSANFYYYRLNGFAFDVDGQTISGRANQNFTWNARMMASIMLPYDLSVQLTGNYRSRQTITQGYRKASYGLDFGARKTFFNKKLTLSVNCRDVLDSRKFRNYTSSDTFKRHQLFRRGNRKVAVTLSWNFGNMKAKRPRMDMINGGQEDIDMQEQYSGRGEE